MRRVQKTTHFQKTASHHSSWLSKGKKSPVYAEQGYSQDTAHREKWGTGLLEDQDGPKDRISLRSVRRCRSLFLMTHPSNWTPTKQQNKNFFFLQKNFLWKKKSQDWRQGCRVDWELGSLVLHWNSVARAVPLTEGHSTPPSALLEFQH